MDLRHFFVVLVREASFGRDVDDHSTLFAIEDRAQYDISSIDSLRSDL